MSIRPSIAEDLQKKKTTSKNSKKWHPGTATHQSMASGDL